MPLPRSLCTRLSTVLLLFSSLLAQDGLLQPSPSCDCSLRVDLAALTGGASATGLGAAWAVPEFAAAGRALVARSWRVFVETQSLRGLHDPATPRLPWSAIDPGQVQRATLVTDSLRKGFAVVVDFDAAHADTATALFEAELARCARGAVPTRIDVPWPGARRLVGAEGVDGGWLLVRGRQLAGGAGDVSLAVAPAVAVDGGAVHAGWRMPSRAMDVEFARMFGFAADTASCWELHVDGRGFREFLGVRGPRRAAWSPRPLAEAPALPRLETPWLVARVNVDPNLLRGLLANRIAAALPDVDLAVLQPVLERLEGGLVCSISAPAQGGLVPRFAMAVAVRDGQDLLTKLRDHAAAAAESGLEVVARSGKTTITWTVRSWPAWLRPSVTIVDGVLLLADSPTTLQALRRATSRCDELFADPEVSPCPAPGGATVLGDCWFDAAAIHEGLGDSVLGSQLFSLALTPNVGDPLWQVEPILDADDLPEPSDVASAFARGRAVFYAGDDEAGMLVAAPALGPLLTAALSVGTGLVPKVVPMALERLLRDARADATQERARRLGEALRRHRQAHGGAMPSEVGDLVALLPPGDDAPLLAPHDPAPLPRPVLWPDGRRGELPSSFQCAPAGMTTAASVPVFAFCGAGHRDRHLLILATGEVLWVPSKVLLDAILTQPR